MIDELPKKLIYEAQSTKDVKDILIEYDLLKRDCWKPIGADYGNETLIRHQSPSPELALGERGINSIDSILMKKCIEHNIDPWGEKAPKSMSEAAKKFCGVPEGQLAKYTGDLYDICEIFCTATGREEGKLTINLVDFGEGQTPDYMTRTFLSLPTGRGSPYKLGIPFVQGRYNQGSGGSYKFSEFTLILTRRAQSLLTSDARTIVDRRYTERDMSLDQIYKRQDEWGWTLVTKFPRRNDNEVTWYGYLTIDDKIPSFKEDTLKLIPPKNIPTVSTKLSQKEFGEELKKLRQRGTEIAYSQAIGSGTLVKLFDFPLKDALNGDIWSQGAREMRSKVFYELMLPIRMIELREWSPRIKGRGDSAYLVGLLNSILQADKGKNQLVREGWPKNDRNIKVDGVGKIHVSKWILETSRGSTDQSENWLGNNSIIYVLNGQIHYREKAFYLGHLKLYNLPGNLLVVINVNDIPIDIRDKIFRVDRTNVEDYPESEWLRDFVEKLITSDDDIKKVNDEKFYEKSSDVDIDEKYQQKIIQKLSKEVPLMREILQGTDLPIVSGDFILEKKIGPQYKTIKYGVPSPEVFRLLVRNHK